MLRCLQNFVASMVGAVPASLGICYFTFKKIIYEILQYCSSHWMSLKCIQARRFSLRQSGRQILIDMLTRRVFSSVQGPGVTLSIVDQTCVFISIAQHLITL
jgi:hypothetical protein